MPGNGCQGDTVVSTADVHSSGENCRDQCASNFLICCDASSCSTSFTADFCLLTSGYICSIVYINLIFAILSLIITSMLLLRLMFKTCLICMSTVSCSRFIFCNLYNLVGWTWWLIGRFGAFRPKGRGFESRSCRHIETWASSSLTIACSASACKLRDSVKCVGRERFWKALAVRSAIEMDQYNTVMKYISH